MLCWTLKGTRWEIWAEKKNFWSVRLAISTMEHSNVGKDGSKSNDRKICNVGNKGNQEMIGNVNNHGNNGTTMVATV